MRAAFPLLLLSLAACKSEPDFDEKYAAQSNALTNAANAMEANLREQLNAATAAGAMRSDPGAADAANAHERTRP